MQSRESILSLLRANKAELKKFGVSDIGLFGSYSRNEQTMSSDIDLLIDFIPTEETFDNFMSVCTYLEQLFRGITIEVVTKNGLSQFIGPKILKEVVYV